MQTETTETGKTKRVTREPDKKQHIGGMTSADVRKPAVPQDTAKEERLLDEAYHKGEAQAEQRRVEAVEEAAEPRPIETPGGKVLNEHHEELHAPRDVRVDVSWRPPENTTGITHWRVYLNGTVVAELEARETGLRLDLGAVEVSGYGMGLGMESPRTKGAR